MRSIIRDKKDSHLGFLLNNKIVKSKRSAEMTIGTLVIIVLAVLLLVVLIIGFTTGWNKLWDKIQNWFGGGSNVDSVKQACQMACTTNSDFEFCCKTREVRYSESDAKEETCNSMKVSCPGINCRTCADSIMCAGDKYEVKTDCNKEAYSGEDKSRRLKEGLVPLGSGNKCCVVKPA